MSLFNDYTSLYVKVLLPLSLPQEYTYRIPQEFNEEVAVGKRVMVQFGKKRIYAAIVVEIDEKPPESYQAKYILAVLDDTPIVSQQQLEFWAWISRYYLCNWGDVMQAALPNALKLQSETLVELNLDADLTKVDLDATEVPIVEHLKVAGSLTLDQVASLLKTKSSYKQIHSLYEKGLIHIREDLHESYKPKLKRHIRFAAAYQSKQALSALFETLSKKVQQLNVVMQLMSTDVNFEGVDKLAFIADYNLSPSSVRTLIKNEVLEEFQVEVDRIVYEGTEVTKENQLTDEQQDVYQSIVTWFEEKEVVLLHGVTSSGKTD